MAGKSKGGEVIIPAAADVKMVDVVLTHPWARVRPVSEKGKGITRRETVIHAAGEQVRMFEHTKAALEKRGRRFIDPKNTAEVEAFREMVGYVEPEAATDSTSGGSSGSKKK